MISSLLCSSDVIAAISIVKYEDQPKLFSIIFGEGIVNDAVALILFQSVVKIANDMQSAEGVKATILLTIFGDFILLALGSIGVGLFFGLVITYMFKRLRFLTVSAIKETLLIFSTGYISYAVGEILHMSGIICLLTSGVVMAHYAWFNLSPQGKQISSSAI